MERVKMTHYVQVEKFLNDNAHVMHNVSTHLSSCKIGSYYYGKNAQHPS